MPITPKWGSKLHAGAQARYRYLTGDGPTLSYLAASDAVRRPVVFLHGLSSPSTSWTPAMEHLGSRWRTFALDLRGHGRSEHTPSRYGLADYCADVARLLVEIGESAILVGHSLGGMVAAELAQVGHPLVSAVFLEDPPLYVLHADVFATTDRSWPREARRAFPIVRDHVRRLQAESADLAAYVQLVGDSPHPAGESNATTCTTMPSTLVPSACRCTTSAVNVRHAGGSSKSSTGFLRRGPGPQPRVCTGGRGSPASVIAARGSHRGARGRAQNSHGTVDPSVGLACAERRALDEPCEGVGIHRRNDSNTLISPVMSR
jgi:pimeloyl-ACP methyl ester carboxylesterase